jgi:hypothetical protein
MWPLALYNTGRNAVVTWPPSAEVRYGALGVQFNPGAS